MATVEFDLGERKLSAAQTKILTDKFDKKTVTLEYLNSDLDLDGNFAVVADWKSGLWDKVCDEIGLKAVTAKSIKHNLVDPTDCAMVVETWDQTYKGKLAFKGKSGDKSSRVIKKNSHPPHVKVTSRINLADCPKEYHADLKHLIGQMQAPASYSYSGSSGSDKGWSVSFTGHQNHEQPGSGFKAYIDEPTNKTGTTWRLYFTYEFDQPTQTLRVSLNDIHEDH